MVRRMRQFMDARRRFRALAQFRENGLYEHIGGNLGAVGKRPSKPARRTVGRMPRSGPHGRGVVNRQGKPQAPVVYVDFAGWRNFRHFLQARHEWQREIVCPIRDSEAYDLRIRR